MSSNTAATDTYGLIWDFTIPKSVTGTQKWILSAMQTHGRQIVTMLWRILADEQDVCDAYQTTFLKLAHIRDFRPKNAKSYVFRTANNTAITILRRRIIEKKHLPNAAKPITQTTPVKELNAKQLQEDLREHITRLPDQLRSVVVLRDLAELSYSQTAKILGITERTARVYRCKAIQQLAVWMNRKEE